MDDNNNSSSPSNDIPAEGRQRGVVNHTEPSQEPVHVGESGMPAGQRYPNQGEAVNEQPGNSQETLIPQGTPPNFASNPSGSFSQQSEDGQSPKKYKRKYPIKIIVTLFLVVASLSLIGVFLFKFLGNGITPPGKKGQIVWWGITYDENVVRPVIDQFVKQNPGVTVNYIKQSSKDYRERLANAIARGEGPDIFEFHNSWTPMFVNNLDTLPSGIMKPAEYAEIYYPIASSDLSTAKGIVGIPLYYDALTLFINEDVFATAGKTEPITWNDFRSTAVDLTQKNEKGVILQAGAAIGTTSNVDYWPEILGLMMSQNKVDFKNPSGKLTEDALVYYSSLSSVNGVWDDTLPPSTQAFANGKTAMYFGPSRVASQINNLNPNLRFRTITIPELPLNNPEEPDVAYATYWANGVWESSPNKEASWELLKFLSRQDSLKRLRSGVLQTSNFSLAYPRRDMAILLKDDPVLGSIVALAPNARSWYLASNTNDGSTGINSQMAAVFKEALDTAKKGRTAKQATEALAVTVREILAKYGIIKIQPSITP